MTNIIAMVYCFKKMVNRVPLIGFQFNEEHSNAWLRLKCPLRMLIVVEQ